MLHLCLCVCFIYVKGQHEWTTRGTRITQELDNNTTYPFLANGSLLFCRIELAAQIIVFSTARVQHLGQPQATSHVAHAQRQSACHLYCFKLNASLRRCRSSVFNCSSKSPSRASILIN